VTNIKDALKYKFSNERFWEVQDQIHVWSFAHELLTTLRSLKTEFSFISLVDLCGLDNTKKKNKKIWQNDFEVVIQLLSLEENQRLTLHIPLKESDVFPDISIIYYNAKSYLNELYDLVGIRFEGFDPDYRMFLSNSFDGFPLRKSFDSKKSQTSNFRETPHREVSLSEGHKSVQKGWVEAQPFDSINNPLGRFLIELEDEKINKVISDLGLTHRGIEKLLEKRKVNEAFHIVGKLNYFSSVVNEIAWAKTVEEFLEIEVSDRVKALRMVFLEFSRVVEHLQFFINICKELEYMSFYWDCIKMRELIYKLYERYSGQRIHLAIVDIGGMKSDVPLGWITDSLDVLKELGKGIRDLENGLNNTRWWVHEIAGADLSADFAIKIGLTGPSLRACGVNYDLRKNQPYYFYNEVDFNIPLGINGSGYDRYLVLIEEMKQSLLILTQVLDNLPTGKIYHPDIPSSINPRFSVLSVDDPKKRHELMTSIIEGVSLKDQDFYSCLEAPNGELGFYLVGDESHYPYRVKVRTPGFPIISHIDEISKGIDIKKFNQFVMTLNLVANEYDR
tara:strand:+ start:192932 stop:194614 length:1683 start_codon:yes stop_codon:yes gene_type:complete